MPTVSVILTSYNHEKYLRDSIDSVLAQTYKDFELIIVDDCSTDRSWEIIESYQDARIVKVRHTENVLFYANHTIRNLTRGKYIAIQHSDDVWEPNKLQQQVAFLELHPECGATFTWAQIVEEDGRPFTDETNFYFDIFDQPNRTRHEWLNLFFYKGNALCHPSVLIRRQCYEACGYYRYGLVQLPDFDMWIRLCMKYEIYVIQERLIRFRLRNNDANSSGNRRDTRIRTVTEFYQLWDDFLAIDSFFELALIFPAASQYYRAEQSNVKFAFAMICLAEGTFQWSRAYGINILFDLMREPETREQLQSVYGFSHRELRRITGENQLFLTETVDEKERQLVQSSQIIMERENQIAQRDNQIAQLNQAITEREHQIIQVTHDLNVFLDEIKALRSELAAVYNSKKWRYGMKVAKVIKFFKPS